MQLLEVGSLEAAAALPAWGEGQRSERDGTGCVGVGGVGLKERPLHALELGGPPPPLAYFLGKGTARSRGSNCPPPTP